MHPVRTHGRGIVDFVGKTRLRKKVLFVKEKTLTLVRTYAKLFKVIVK